LVTEETPPELVERAFVVRAEYFQLKLTLSDRALADWRTAEIWTGLDAVASSSHLELAWPQDARVAEAARPLVGTTLTLVPGTMRAIAESVASELRSVPYVLAVDVEPRTWTIRRDAPVEPAERQIFFRLLLVAYLYDPQGIGAAYAALFRNDDEYWFEVMDLLRLFRRLPATTSLQEVEAALHEVFDLTTMPAANIETLAEEAWHSWQQRVPNP